MFVQPPACRQPGKTWVLLRGNILRHDVARWHGTSLRKDLFIPHSVIFGALPFLALIELIGLCRQRDPSWRRAMLTAAVLWGTSIVAITEGLSLFELISRPAIAGSWTALCIVLAIMMWHRRPGAVSWSIAGPRLDPLSGVLVAGLGLILAVTLTIALTYPPTNWDSFTYHLSRVEHWVQNHSVKHYPTHVLRELHRSPGAEFVVMQFRILTGGDYLSNLVQWLAMAGSLLGVSLIAKQLGASGGGQLAAAVVAATIPMGILQSTTTQTDYVGTFWLVTLAHSLLTLIGHRSSPLPSRLSLQAGAALGLALLTKPTGYLYAFPLLVWWLICSLRQHGRHAFRSLAIIAVLSLSFNLGYYARNLDLFGSPFGTAGAEECEKCKPTNDVFSPSAFISNLSRNIGMHLTTPSDTVNEWTEQVVTRFHELLGIAVDDPRTTWNDDRFWVMHPVFHEDFDGNFLHVMLIMFAGIALMSVKSKSTEALAPPYAGAIVSGFLLHCLILKWNGNHSRLHLPFFVLWAPLIGTVLSRACRQWVWKVVAVALLIAAVPWLVSNVNRPLIEPPEWLGRLPQYKPGRPTIFTTDRLSLYLRGLLPNGEPFFQVAQFVKQARCTQIGLIRQQEAWEYPLWIVLRAAEGDAMRMENIEVRNVSASLGEAEPFRSFQPCAVVLMSGGGTISAYLRVPNAGVSSP